MNPKKFRNPNTIPTQVLIYMAWRNLISKKLRAFLTIFGITIGIGAIFFLLSFGLGLQQLVTSQVLGNQSIKAVDVFTPNSKVLSINDTTAEKIRNLPHVVRVGTSYLFDGNLNRSGSSVNALVYGMDSNYLDLTTMNLKSGRSFEPKDTNVMIINTRALQAVGMDTGVKSLGEKIRLTIQLNKASERTEQISTDFTIVGIAESGNGSEIFVPNHVFQVAGVTTYKDLKLEADSNGSVANLRKQIETLGYQTNSPLDTIDQINQIFDFFNTVLAGFGSVGMVVAVLGMFNTLTISLLERTKEIGLMLAMGSRNSDIRKLFIMEAAMLSLIGAVVGIVLAIVLGWIVNFVLNNMAKGRSVVDSFSLFATPWWLILGSIAFMLLVGLAVVYLPARRAARINPIDALRRE
jgi:ABC-type antimicrobial peptide transport system permease subunit